MGKTTQNKQVFSVSKKYKDIDKILESVENKSEFICQAIMEKASKSSKVEDDIILENKIKKVLKEMMSENIFLVSGNVGNIVRVLEDGQQTCLTKNDSMDVDSKNEDTEDDSDYLKGIFENM